MTTSQPPRVATWLLQRWGSGPQRESLVGDLIEQYQGGRSSTWYWRQALKAIIVETIQEMRAHKVLAIRALIVGWTTVTLLIRGNRTVNPLLVGSWEWTAEWLYRHFGFFFSPAAFAGAPLGAVGVGRFGFFFPLPSVVLLLLGAGMTGWVVARTHRPYAMPMVLAYAVSLLVYPLTAVVVWGPPQMSATALALGLFVGFFVSCTVLGGLLNAGSVQSSRALKTVRPQSAGDIA